MQPILNRSSSLVATTLVAFMAAATTATAHKVADQQPSSPQTTIITYGNASPDLTGILKQVKPAVAKIETGGKGAGIGSGVTIDPNGYILTNRHVVTDDSRVPFAEWKNSEKITVSYENGTSYPATIVAVSQVSDLALVKIDAAHLPYAVLHAEPMNVGDSVFAIGHPFGNAFAYTVSRLGILSSLNSMGGWMDSTQDKMHFWGSDINVNPGNSGGPLFGLDGKIAGIATGRANISYRPSFAKVTPPDEIKYFLETVLPKYKVQEQDPVSANLAPLQPDPLPHLIQSARASVVQIILNEGQIGNGVVVSPDGIIATISTISGFDRNNVQVSLPNDPARYPATKIGEENGVVLLKINAPRWLSFVSLTKPEDLHVGDTVLSFNAQINENDFVSRGIVSEVPSDDTPFITDAPITKFDGGAVLSIHWNNPAGPYVSLSGLVLQSAGYTSAFTIVAQSKTLSKLLAEARHIAEKDPAMPPAHNRFQKQPRAPLVSRKLPDSDSAACVGTNDLPTQIAQASSSSLLVHLKIPGTDKDDPAIEVTYPGVLIDANGSVIATEVFKAYEQLSVTTKDGETLPAVVVGVDNDKRLSLLKIAPINYPYAPLSTTPMHVGDSFIAIGWETPADQPISRVAVAGRVSNTSRTFDISAGSRYDILPATTPLMQGDFPTMNGAILYTMRDCKIEVAGVAPRAFITGPGTTMEIGNRGISFAVPASAIPPTFTPAEPVPSDDNQEQKRPESITQGLKAPNRLASTPRSQP